MNDTCTWKEMDEFDSRAFDTGCGHAFELNDGTPSSNEMQFCCYCGKRIEVEWFIDVELKSVDPPGCGCTGCLTGESKPINECTRDEIEFMLAGNLVNNSGSEIQVRYYLDIDGEITIW
jgi:hypothetical protein